MIGMGTIVNAGAIVAGSLLGLLFKKGIPERFRKIIFTASGTAVFFIGALGVVEHSIKAAQDGSLSGSYMMGLLLSLVLGGIVGELIRIDRFFDKIGEKLTAKTKEGAGTEGFVTASVVFCAGAMAIVGGINDGAMGDPSMLYTKAVIDGITAIIFTSMYGVTVIFSAVSVFVYQGIFTLLGGVLTEGLPSVVISQMALVGSAVLMLIAFSLWDVKKFNVANMIPAVFMPILLSWLPL